MEEFNHSVSNPVVQETLQRLGVKFKKPENNTERKSVEESVSFGKITDLAHENGMTTGEFIKKVQENPHQYSKQIFALALRTQIIIQKFNIICK
jgi:hypothetical protein